MTKLKFPFLAIITALLMLTACNEDIKITGSAKESAVVYAVLDPSEHTHYIKVNRAYVTSNNNIETAAIADSNYFSSVVGTVKEYQNGNLRRTFTLVDTLIENKESGVFYYPYQRVLMFKTTDADPLRDENGFIYKLNLNINDGEFEVNGETELVRDVVINTLSNNVSKFSFANNVNHPQKYKSQTLAGNYGTGSMYDLRLRIHISEFTSATDSTNKSFDWKIRSGNVDEVASKIINTSANGETFYEVVKSNITNNSAIIKRNLIGIDIILTSGSQVLFNYISLSKPSSSIAQNKMTYTNLTATNERNVLGIFTARTTFIREKRENVTVNGYQMTAVDLNTMRELCKGTHTGLLNFCTPDVQYQAQNFFCN